MLWECVHVVGGGFFWVIQVRPQHGQPTPLPSRGCCPTWQRHGWVLGHSKLAAGVAINLWLRQAVVAAPPLSSAGPHRHFIAAMEEVVLGVGHMSFVLEGPTLGANVA